MYQNASLLLAFSLIAYSITVRVGRSGISGPIVCFGRGKSSDRTRCRHGS
jgi:hypothetical protein